MTTVIYHSADFDGIFCREIAKHFLGEKDVNYIGWNFGDPKIPIPEGADSFFILDLSPDCLAVDFKVPVPIRSRIIWIDHHKTSIDKWPADIPGYRIDGVAACRLAWQWFDFVKAGWQGAFWPSNAELPRKEEFVERAVSEPLAVRLAGEYDVWDKRDPDAETFQYALRAVPLTDGVWDEILSLKNFPNMIDSMLDRGEVAQYYAREIDASICNSLTWITEWEGLKWLTVNQARFNSNLFAVKDTPDTGHDALLGFRFDGKKWMVSLYHAKHRTDLDLSTIAAKYGGGGHRGACGFTCKKLPPFLNP